MYINLPILLQKFTLNQIASLDHRSSIYPLQVDAKLSAEAEARNAAQMQAGGVCLKAEEILVVQGSLNYPCWGIKQCILVWKFEGFPEKNTALFGLVSYNDPWFPSYPLPLDTPPFKNPIIWRVY